ncbi:hypothetical protein [Limnobacter sp.]|jgi:Flp pilus assembly protein TadB|uniref:hypothetical protein n=1 Tax=Limnobacter sp. TaxID=2003368 RepID=UPI0027BAFE1A|nr:hypothetical protein [Limnobacter sp.]
MESTIHTLLKLYEQKRAEYQALVNPKKKSGIKEFFRTKSNLSASELLDKEFEFQQELSRDQQLIDGLKGLKKDKAKWDGSVGFLKSRSEDLSCKIDLKNYLHTFFAFLLAVLVIMAEKFGPQNWIIAIMVGIFICIIFKDRSELRRELLSTKEFSNFIESNKDKIEELDTPNRESSQTYWS